MGEAIGMNYLWGNQIGGTEHSYYVLGLIPLFAWIKSGRFEDI